MYNNNDGKEKILGSHPKEIVNAHEEQILKMNKRSPNTYTHILLLHIWDKLRRPKDMDYALFRCSVLQSTRCRLLHMSFTANHQRIEDFGGIAAPPSLSKWGLYGQFNSWSYHSVLVCNKIFSRAYITDILTHFFLSLPKLLTSFHSSCMQASHLWGWVCFWSFGSSGCSI